MSLLDNDIEKQADENLKAWDEKRKRKQPKYDEYTWMINGERVKFGNNDFHLSSGDYSDFKYEVYKF